MSFTTVKKIGSGQVFTTLQTWEDGAPVNYTTAEKSAAGTFLVAAFTQGETLSFVGSGAAGKFLDSDSTGAGNGTYVSYSITSGNPAASDVVTGATSGATCVLSSGTPTATACIWQGQINASSDSFSTASGVLLTISGGTVSSSAYAELTTATGASFKDNANVRTNALRYNTSNGAAISSSASFSNIIAASQDFCRFSFLQISGTGSAGSCINQTTGNNIQIDGCICEAAKADIVTLTGTAATSICRNSLVVNRLTSSAEVVLSTNGTWINCTIVTPNDLTKPTTIFRSNYGTSLVVKNCAAFWGTNLKTGGTAVTYTTNANDNGSPPAGFTQMTYDTAMFVVITTGNFNYQLASGSPLINAGTVDTTNAATDISGLSRGATRNDIGCWQSPDASATDIIPLYQTIGGFGPQSYGLRI